MKHVYALLLLASCIASVPVSEFEEDNSGKKDPLVGMKTCDIIAYHGYVCETHHAETKDGYILTLFRIGGNDGKPAVVLQHGFVDSSATWVMNDPKNSLGFIAHDAGYDVWLGNSRGNDYSLNATFCTDCKTNDKFWDFTFDDMAKYDVPAVIEYITATTSQEKISWVGHSQGTTQMFIALSRDSEYLSTKLSSFVALAPVTYLNHPGGLLLGTLSKLDTAFLVSKLGNIFPPADDWIDKVVPGLCKVTPTICSTFIFALVGGGDSKQLNKTRLPIYTSHTPAITSTKDLTHWTQNIHDKTFKMFDYGNAEENRQHYGQPTPPAYELNNITKVPIAFVYGGLDYMGDPTDVQQLMKEVPKSAIALNLFFPKLNHMDFVWGQDVTELVYTPVLNFISTKLSQ